MKSQLMKSIISDDLKAVEDAIEALDAKNWMIDFVDEFLPFMLMETNLKYGSFHTVKMTLFLRKLAMKGMLSDETERKVLRLLSLEMVNRDWVNIKAAQVGKANHKSSFAILKMLEELDDRNVHNAYYYATDLLETDPGLLSQTLLAVGSKFIPNTLGHSISCFYPVVEDLIYTNSRYRNAAVLSYLMYLARFDISESILKDVEEKTGSPEDYGELLKRSASGAGIINLHHMITFYILMTWERVRFNKENASPFGILEDWIAGKEIDETRETFVKTSNFTERLPESYSEFSDKFSLKELDQSIGLVFELITEKPKSAYDWLIRCYAENYEPTRWNPHYYTSLYCALGLCLDENIEEFAGRMALDQAIRYYASRMKK
jgi:hypothetical protein